MKLKTQHIKLNLDTSTPVSAYLCVRDKYPNSILLESSDYNTREGNYSIIACKPLSTLQVIDDHFQIIEGNSIIKTPVSTTNLKDELHKYVKSFETESINVAFPYSAVFGYSSFDSIPMTENIIFRENTDEIQIPKINYSFYSLLIVFDHFLNQLHVVSFNQSEEIALESLNQLVYLLNQQNLSNHTFESIGEIDSTTSDKDYLENVQVAKQHCQKGDVFQLVLSKRFTQNFIGDEFNVYRSLKQINPSPYLFYFDFGSFKLFGSSPEAQLIVNNGKAEIHPIAGTYKRTQNDKADQISAQKLAEDSKENSEHMMLVDLARNDLSICCKNVKVESLKNIQRYSHVIHLVSKVTGEIKPNETSINLLYQTFPAGTLSGAPKHKALELINKYEPVSRNFYGGCVGYLETNGNINHAIIIRSFMSYQNKLYFQAGAGIVVDSVPEKELNEIYNKVGALKKAIKEANKLNLITNFAKDETISAR